MKYRIIIPDEPETFIDLDCYNIKPIYEISNYGTIRRKATKRELKPELNNSGYLRVTLATNDGKYKKFFIHILVATMYIENDELKPQVNHITEGKKEFNFYKNLEWMTSSENQIHHFLYGDNKNRSGNKINHYKGEDRYNANVNEILVRQICEMLEKHKSTTYIKSVITSDLSDVQLNSLIHHLRKKNSWKHITKDYDY